MIIASVTDNPALSKRQVSEHLAYYVGGMGAYYGNVLKRFGYAEEVENITSAWNKGSKTEAVGAVSDRMLSSLTFSGSLEQARARIGEYYEGEREEDILRMRFGLGYEDSYTLDEIGNRYSLTRERIRQIERRALKKLKQQQTSSMLRDFITCM